MRACPELFRAVASFRSVVDPNGTGRNLTTDPLAWGDPQEQTDVWAAHDPVAMAGGLEGMPVYLSWGTGSLVLSIRTKPRTTTSRPGWPPERSLRCQIGGVGCPGTVESGPGTHTWPYFQEGLRRALPVLLEAVGE
jgi:S-formylglutathione hydrolase FrmB